MSFQRLQFLITGQVQGVGFRPHVYRVASELGLTGWVKNNAKGVLIEIQGVLTANFLPQLTCCLPPLAHIHSVQTEEIALVENELWFEIVASQPGESHTFTSPDTAICNACLQELFDPNSRFYQYPFLNCTNCGPRLSITRALPYDRENTSMQPFPFCQACYAEYSDPNNRRYHAQPTACRQCGPQLSTSFETIVEAIAEGKILALKGLGGYHLLCDARNEQSVRKLRKRKLRDAKPFALMVANLASARTLVEVGPLAEQALSSPARPIVILKQSDETLPESLAPGLSHLGIMLPVTPLHYVLFHALAGYPKGTAWLDEPNEHVLVMTSANLGSHPLIIEDDEAHHKLFSIADTIVSYNRTITTRMDDSVVRIINNTPTLIRRARGYVPKPIPLAYPIPTTLALGGHMKNTFCITRDDEAFVSQHIGSLSNKATIDFFHESLAYWQRFLDVRIERIACDLHPDFYTSQFAEDYQLPIIAIQHHHAHLASVAAEHRICEPALGLILDGYGYGTDRNAWGGELLTLRETHMQRLGSFLPIPQPGGDIAAREPWRMAASVLHCLGKHSEILNRFADKPQVKLLTNLLQRQASMPLTSSCGRWFDAVSALLGVNAVSRYEGQAAQQLESLVTQPTVLQNGWTIEHDRFSLLPTCEALLHTKNAVEGANLFHGTLIAGLAEWLFHWAQTLSIQTILLSGGCFINKIMSEGLYQALTDRGLQVYLPKQLPPNDGGLSLGQAWIAGHQTITNVSKDALCV